MAIRVFNMLQDGMGGLSWDGLPVAIDHYGIEDTDGLIERLLVIKSHKPEKDAWND